VRETNQGDRQRLSRLLETVAERLPPDLLPSEWAEITREELRRLFGRLAEHVRTCPEWAQVEPAKVRKTVASLYTDGASRGNPGPAGAGVLLLDEKGRPILELNRFLGKATNNEAEYQALIAGLEAAEKLGVSRLQIFLDSELVVKQLQGEYRVRNPRLQPLFDEVASRLQRFSRYAIMYVPRDRNQAADRLANEAVDRGLRGGPTEEYRPTLRE
jgi:ribonuclease HI